MLQDLAQSSESEGKRLFLELVELAPEQRASFLAALQRRSVTLHGRVLRLLHAHERAERVTAQALGAVDTRNAGARLPVRLGNYELLEEIGSGGSGVVYRARQLDLSRTVAVKLLRAGRLASEDEVRRFQVEAETAARLDHPSIVPVHEVGFHEGRHFLSMKLVQGVSLDRCLERFREPRSAAALVARIARAVDHGHHHGVLHRDLKSSNVLIDGEGRPYVIDFGTAKLLSEVDATVVTMGILGTPSYMAPEQTSPGGQATVATDVYGLGCILYELLAGHPPFSADDLLEMLRQVREESPPPLRAVRPELHRDLETICQTCLAKDPRRRYASALALAEDLERWTSFRPIEARPTTRLEGLALLWRRKPVVSTLAMAVGLLLLTTVVGSVVASITLRAERAEARRMADVVLLAQKQEQAAALWPLGADLVVRIDSFLESCRPLLERLPDHQRVLAGIEELALPYADEQRERDHRETRSRIAEVVAEQDRLEVLIDRSESPERAFEYQQHLDQRIQEQVALEQRLERRLTWEFPEDDGGALAARHGVLSKLVADLRRFSDPENGTIADLRRRRGLARQTVQLSLVDAREDWRLCAERVASDARYRGLELVPQEGLLPLGPDPRSGLEEFLHWPTHLPGHFPPRRGADGELTPLRGETGVILVLLPGGPFVMGASRDEELPNYDPAAKEFEFPPHRVTLDPFFMGKHELSRGQWVRLSGADDPSYWVPRMNGGFPPEAYPRMPVDRVSWFDSKRELERGALVMPTEARWEYACRAGTDGAWSWGRDPMAYEAYANLGDRRYNERFENAVQWMTRSNDGFAAVAPVGSLLPNAFGLHDMHGNVHEWSLDDFGPYSGGNRPGDGKLLVSDGYDKRVARGACFNNTVYEAAAYSRSAWVPDRSETYCGVRAARDLQP